MSLEVTSSKVTVEWKIDGVNELLAKARTGDVDHSSPASDAGRRELSFTLRQSEPESCGIYVRALPHEADYRRSGSAGWHRGKYKFRVEVPDSDASLYMLDDESDGSCFASTSSCWGYPEAVTRDVLQSEHVKTKNAFLIRCTIETVEASRVIPPLRATSGQLVRSMFNNPVCADVVFEVRPLGNSALFHIPVKLILIERCPHFKAVLTSGFSESGTLSLDLSALNCKAVNKLVGDANDFEIFEIFEMALTLDPASGDAQQGKKRLQATLSGPTHPYKGTREFQRIQVTDCSYATIYSLLFFLHTGQVAFLPLQSNYLLASQDEPHDPPHPLFSPALRDAWLEAQVLGNEMTHCSAHALYRLADRYLLDCLREYAKQFIISNLTVQNVTYEAFSSLSRDFDDFQKDVVAFISQNWSKVRSSRAWSQSMELLEEGQLPGGAAVLCRVHEPT